MEIIEYVMNITKLEKLAVLAIFIAIIYVAFRVFPQVKTFKFFALGDRNVSIIMLVGSIIASHISGSEFFLSLRSVYESGFGYFIPSLGAYIGLIILAIFVIPKMHIFLGDLSIAETMGRIYGSTVRYIVSSTSILSYIIVIVLQFNILVTIVQYFFGTSAVLATICISLILILYSSFGGIKSVIYTDFIQVLTFIIAIIITLFVMAKLALDNYENFSVLQEHKIFRLREIFDATGSFEDISHLFLFIMFRNILLPTNIHRILVSDDLKKSRQIFLIAAFILIIIAIIIALISVLLFVGSTGLDGDDMLNFILHKLSDSGVTSILLLGLVLVSMSGADSYINTAAVTFVNDICKNVNSKYHLLLARIASFLIGIISLILSLYMEEAMSVMLLFKTLYVGMVVPILICTIFGFRTHKNLILASMYMGALAITAFPWLILMRGSSLLYAIEQVSPIGDAVGAMMTTFILIWFHYFFDLEGGFMTYKRPTIDSHKILRLEDKTQKINSLRQN
ncbi:sodium:solute symporter family protein [Rickettsia endosymbiont of Cardiosporidium cionae]|uniref:sodium:solute symporter family protein n=1 Tax=Rickettsia endosymbiont of Cardiosporidium cionae TaxID=2777155 RepID=UPI001894F47A|nr:sodium:solute symporter family protein [Rickettsia endosymbiont of Cardiosporidium cionae]KAF8818588.1 alkaline phosphatase [Rickettsia endosymbiont of Cardiosporidium cionae]